MEQFDALYTFFEAESKGKEKKTREKETEIFTMMQNRYTILHFQFLKNILPLVCKRNAEFQGENSKVYALHSKIVTLFKVTINFYLDDDYVDKRDSEFIAIFCETETTI